MTHLHIHRIETRVVSQREDGVRWCFECRRRVPFTFTVHAPVARRSYYGPHVSIKCEQGHLDGDLFPGRFREWAETDDSET